MIEKKAPGAMTREMRMVHTMLLREFGLAPGLVDSVAEGDRDRAELIAGHLALVSAILHHHHHGEDLVIWPRLHERCPAQLGPLVGRMEAQHQKIAALGTELAIAVEAWRDRPDAANHAAVIHALVPLNAVLADHLTEEVETVMPLVERHITAEEWDAMVSEGVADLPPEQLPLMMGMTIYDGDPEAVRDALASVPAEARDTVAELAPRCYAEYAEALHGTATPPRVATLAP